MKIASAQTSPKRGDIESNLKDHYDLIEKAAENQVNLIAFPEMSITGYERDKASSMAFSESDLRLNTLRQMSVDNKMFIIVGAPILIKNNLFIGSFIIKPDSSISIYTKQYLHSGEEEFFQSSFDFNPMVEYENEKISFAICADIDNPLHAESAGKRNTTIYVSSIFFSPNGIPNAYNSLSDYSKKFGINILMANYTGQSWGCDSGGKSGFWDKKGNLIANMNSSDSGLLIIEKQGDNWVGEVLN